MPNRLIWFYQLVALLFCFAFAGALVWVEFGAMCLYGRWLPAYPSGWPFCHSVFHSVSGRYELNAIAMVENAVACILLLFGTAFVARTWLLLVQSGLRVPLREIFIWMTAIAVEIALLRNQSTIALTADWLALGLYREISSTRALTHWASRLPFQEWGLRAAIVLMTVFAIYMCFSLTITNCVKATTRLRKVA